MTADASQLNCIEFQNQLRELIESGADLSNHPHVQICERCKAILQDIHRVAENARHFRFGTEE